MNKKNIIRTIQGRKKIQKIETQRRSCEIDEASIPFLADFDGVTTAGAASTFNTTKTKQNKMSTRK